MEYKFTVLVTSKHNTLQKELHKRVIYIFTYATLSVLNNSEAQERKAKIKGLKYQPFLDFKTNLKYKSPVGFLTATLSLKLNIALLLLSKEKKNLFLISP